MNRTTHVFLVTVLIFVSLSTDWNVSVSAQAHDCSTAQIPGGGPITFVSDRDGDNEIYTMDGNECNLVKLTDNTSDDIFPSVSPDGSKIAFSSNRDGWNWEVFVMNSDGSNVLQLTFTQDPRYNGAPSNLDPKWSPDGTQIAYMYGAHASNQAIYIMNADGTNNHLLVNTPSDCGWPEWLPNGTQISFGSRACGGCSTDNDIELINTDGTGRFMLLQTGGRDQEPIFSPDGSKFAFTSNRDEFNSYEIYVANADGTNQVRLTSDLAWDWLPTWSADGNKIIFVSNRTGTHQLYLMNMDGSNLIRLTNNNANDLHPVWGGQHITTPPTASKLTIGGATGTACNAGNVVTLDFGFTDSGVNDSPWTVDINWGDGNHTTYTTSLQGVQPQQSHTYGVGIFTITVKIADKDNATGSNSSSNGEISHLYSMSGILQPFNADGTSVWKYGSTLPVKVQVTDCNASPVPGLSPKVGTSLVSTNDPTISIDETPSTSAADTTGIMRYDSTSGQYIYNFGSKFLADPSGTYYMTVKGMDSIGNLVTSPAMVQVKFGVRPK